MLERRYGIAPVVSMCYGAVASAAARVRHVDSYVAHISAMCALAAPRRDGRQHWSGNNCGTHRRNLMARKDSDIRDDVYAELAWDPRVTIANLDVSVHDGYVTLTGSAATFATKYAARDAAYRVYGVKDVDNVILVDPAAFGLRTDAQIAADVRSMLVLDLDVPDTRVTVSVLDGVVTLGGDV